MTGSSRKQCPFIAASLHEAAQSGWRRHAEEQEELEELEELEEQEEQEEQEVFHHGRGPRELAPRSRRAV